MTTPSIFFCHIPKTAGTSLRLALEALFEPHAVVPDTYMMKRHQESYPPYDLVALTLQRQARSIKLLRGHYPFAMHRLLPGATTVALLREPIARTVSNIRHIIRHGSRDATSIMDDLSEGRLPVENNLMTRMMGADFDFLRPGQNIRSFLDDPIDDSEALLSRACLNVEGAHVLGLVENMGSFDAALKASDIQVSVGVHNVAPEGDFNLTDRQMETIRRGNQLDILLYRHAAEDLSRRDGYRAA